MDKRTNSNAVNIRALALDSLIEILENEQLSHVVCGQVLEKYQFLDRSDRSFYKRLTYGTIEKLKLIDYIINQFSAKKVEKLRPVIRNILRLSVYQILFMDKIPDSAACNEAVKMAKKRKFASLAGFINANLRAIIKNKDSIKYPDKKNPVSYYSIMYSMPEYLIEEWLEQFGAETLDSMLSKMSEKTGTTIRCNTAVISKEELKKKLSEQNIEAVDGFYAKYSMIISGYDYVNAIDAFLDGDFYIQDESSQLAVECAGIGMNMSIIDVCSAPGGKAIYAAQLMQGTGNVLCRDLTDSKTDMIAENVMRCNVENITVETFDALILDENLIGKMDVVIADLPCSGLGVIAKKPDIRLKTTKEDVIELAKLQRDILKVVSQYVKPGGVLMYSTCTVTREENQNNRKWILENLPFKAESLDNYLPECLRTQATANGELALIPGINQCDGFYIARFISS